ncbi:MAG: glycosyltransferase [Deltaproteobacteria bacterium]|nr:glycosyltransferase [Deltaproteobacteria bacterium]
MKISGFTFIRKALEFGYPAAQSIKSILPICDEFIVNVGESDDGTLELIKSINDPKIKIITTKWNENLTAKGFVYGQQKMIAQYSCTGDWAFYLECDEVVHEDDLTKIYDSMKRNLDKPEVEALVFDYLHFYGNHSIYLESPAWYRRAPRIIRNTIRSYAPDGLFFVVLDSNKKGRYPRAALTGATIYHYGWARPEHNMNMKTRHVQRYWNKPPMNITYGNIDPAIIREFKGTHPAVIKDWLPQVPALFELNPGYRLSSRDKRQRIKMIIEKLTKLDLSKKHFKLIDSAASTGSK